MLDRVGEVVTYPSHACTFKVEQPKNLAEEVRLIVAIANSSDRSPSLTETVTSN